MTRTRGDERGAIIVLAAVLTVVMVGMAALVIDVGAILDEKRQLQNGADSAALAVARSCARGEACTQATADALSAPLITANSGQNSAVVTLDQVNGKVTVVASTGSGSNGVLPFKFGQILTGKEGQRVTATAVVRWGGIKATSVIPLTISKCEFDAATSNNTVFDVPRVVFFKTQVPTCNLSGLDVPGGFGWVKDTTPGDCSVSPSAGGTIGDDTGAAGTPNGCDLASLLGKDVSLVVYNGASGGGNNATYAIYGFGIFRLTGYRFPAAGGGSAGIVPCSSPNTCIGGYFVRSTGSAGTGTYGGPNLAGNRVYLVS